MEVASESQALLAESAWLTEVLVTLATTPRRQQFDRVGPLILQVIRDQFDPTRQGMVVKLIQCVHPAAGKPVRSLRLTHAVGTFPPDQDMLPAQLYLAGRESLPGQVLASRCAALVEDVRQPGDLPRPANQWVKSTIMVPLLFSMQVAGCLAVCSPSSHSFRSPQLELLQQYATLLALTLPPEAFYVSEQISLALMPSPDVQRPLASRFQTLLMNEVNLARSEPARIEAERLAWQRVEEEVIALAMSSLEDPIQPNATVGFPAHPPQISASPQSPLPEPLRADQPLLTLFQKQHALDDLKERFVITASHELRTPLTIIGGYLDLLQDALQQMDQQQIVTMLSQVRDGYSELLSLVNIMTEAVASSEPSLVTEAELLPIKEIIQEAIAQFDASQVQAYTIELSMSDVLQVWANRQALGQVVRHLLSNVFKYVPHQTTVVIGARLLEMMPFVCVSLQDAGPGIPPEEIPQIFERFVRLGRDVASPIPGMGLGLFISKRLVEAMGGQIWVESSGQEGAGSCLCFTLPSQPRLHVQSS